MKHILLFLLLGLMTMLIDAQIPKAMVDINMEGRKESEVNSPGYTSWFIGRVHSGSITVSGVTFTLIATAPTISSTFRTSWSKALVQDPYYSRLVNDGIKVDNDILLANPGIGAEMELHIAGLPVGKHTIQTYHNIWSNPEKTDFSPINVYLNGDLVHSNVKGTVRIIESTDATILLTEMEVKQAGEVMVLRLEAIEDFVPEAGKAKDLNVYINAFELNSYDASKQAIEPVPTDGDLHVDADSGFFTLQWKPALNGLTQTHTLYFGTDPEAVASATSDNTAICKGEFPLGETEYRVDGLYNLNDYYWRVDETDSTGATTQGKIWSFRPRHLAFRGAEGYGRFATGGRGGKVVEVSNLNPSGPGSFHEAVTNDIGPRTIVFTVSGIITLDARLVLKEPFITIAGQTAPGKGICIRKAPLGLGKESITRFIRIRLGAGETFDGMGMAGNNHAIADHCSVSWTIDEGFSSRGGKNLTLQRTMISEALNIADHENYGTGSAHGYAASIGGDVGTFHHNLLAHCNGRNWSLAGGLDGNGFYAGRMDIFNNVVYNWQGRTTDGGAHEVNFVNNYYKKGAASGDQNILTAQLEGLGKGSQSYFFSGNILQNKNNGSFICDGTDNTCKRGTQVASTQVVDWEVFVNEPFFPSYATIETAEDAYKSVLSDVGCTMPVLDDHDKRIIQETLAGNYTYIGSKSKVGGIIDHQDDAGGYEDYPELERPADFDSDHDGLPDWWENYFGSNPNSAEGDFSDANADPDKDGYVALEDYLEWMSVPHFFMEQNVSDTIELSGLTAGYVDPTYSCDNAEHFSLSFIGSTLIITPSSHAHGINYLNIKAVDSEGSSITRMIGIFEGIDRPVSVEEPIKLSSLNKEVLCTVYPSMFDTKLNLEISSNIITSVSAILYDLTGKSIINNSYDIQPGINRYQFDCPAFLSKQLYLLRIVDKNSSELLEVQKVFKK